MDRTKTIQGPAHQEAPIATANGFIALVVALLLLALGGLMVARSVGIDGLRWGGFGIGLLLLVVAVLTLAGLYTLQPNEAAIIQLFGAYRGTSRVPGLRATNPVLLAQEDLAARAQPERRPAQGQRQARQPDRDRGGGRLARRRHGEGRVRRRRLREFREGAERGGGAPPRVLVRLRRRGGEGRRARADAPRVAPTSSPRRSSASCRRAWSRRASWSRRRASCTSRTRRRSPR